ncbi:MAG: hypothetical protein P4L46_24820 [Fimbriimonas sp.]|nr:hypothetical protein [Fimbriimonas sp.]
MILTSIALTSTLLTGLMIEPKLHNPFGVAWGFLYGYQGVPSPRFMPELRRIGGSWTKLYLIWNQVEPEPGKYDWRAVDTFLAQLKSPDEALLSVFSTSTWATRTKATILPPSPAKNADDYDRFIRELVRHCKGRVRYFQNDSEPNNPVYWSGTSSEFAAETRAFSKAVRETDPHAKVILGGYDGLFNPGPGFKFPTQEASLKFFRDVLAQAPNTFDYFDLRLYADPSTIPARVQYIRSMMAELGEEKPIVCTEYNGPGFFEFPDNLKYVQLVMKWSASVANQSTDRGGGGVAELYRDPKTLKPQTQMFLFDVDPVLDAKLRRIQCRDLVERNLYALSAGVQRTLFWDLWHDTTEHNDVMALMYGKLKLFDYANGKLDNPYPAAISFSRMSRNLAGVESVRRIEVPGSPLIRLFEARCGSRGTVLVAWKHGPAFAEEPADTPVEFAWSSPRASAQDALGDSVKVSVKEGKVSLAIGATPVFIVAH